MVIDELQDARQAESQDRLYLLLPAILQFVTRRPPYASAALGEGIFATAGSTTMSPSFAATVEVRAFLPARADRQLDLLVDERFRNRAPNAML